jgi:hypothetical protein
MIYKKPDNIEKAVDTMHKELREEEKVFCSKCRPLFRKFLKKWFEKYPDK